MVAVFAYLSAIMQRFFARGIHVDSKLLPVSLPLPTQLQKRTYDVWKEASHSHQ
tara:strand:- start:273 stop:434 length:162 start_codon:yes stop_codon:yes gene_type:complete